MGAFLPEGSPDAPSRHGSEIGSEPLDLESDLAVSGGEGRPAAPTNDDESDDDDILLAPIVR